MSSRSDVVIVGAGIGGAVLALALGRQGWKVTLLEREAEPPRVVRPEVLWGPTPAALDPLGIGETIRTRTSLRLRGVEARQGNRRRLRISQQVMAAARTEAYSTDPGMTRAAILEAALATGRIEVCRGAEVTECIHQAERIVGVRGKRSGKLFEALAPLIVGDDGAHSVVRTAMGSTIDLEFFPLDFMSAPLTWPAALPPDEARIWLDPEARAGEIAGCGCLPWPGGRGVLLIPLPHDRVVPLLDGGAEAFWRKMAKLIPLANQLEARPQFPADFKHVRRPFGHARTYVADGAAILGDAAHPMSPAGGQGANAAIWDALALADTAHEALSAGDVSRQKLARYELLRRQCNAASVRISRITAGALKNVPHVPGRSRVLPALLGIIDSLPALKSLFLRTISRTFVTRAASQS